VFGNLLDAYSPVFRAGDGSVFRSNAVTGERTPVELPAAD
jgi:hypothetical protein